MPDYNDLLKHVEDVQYSRFDPAEFEDRLRRRLVESLAKGMFTISFPQCMVEDIHAFAKECLADGEDEVVLAFETEQGGLVALQYTIQMSPDGVLFSPANEIHIPRRPSSRALPQSFTAHPVLFIDVGAS